MGVSMRYITGKRKSEPEKDMHIISKESLSADIEQNMQTLKLLLYGCSDAVLKQFCFGNEPQIKGVMVYFDGLVNKSIVELSILKPLLIDLKIIDFNSFKSNHSIIDIIK